MLNITKEQIIDEITTLILKDERYKYILDTDLDELRKQYGNLIIDQINDIERLEAGAKLSFSEEFNKKNSDLHHKILSSVNKTLKEKLNYTSGLDSKNKGEILIKACKGDDEYYIYLVKLALEMGLEFKIGRENTNSCTNIKFEFINKEQLTPELFIIDESFNTNLTYISNKIPRKIIEIHSGSMNKNNNGLLIYSNGYYLCNDSYELTKLIIGLLYECYMPMFL